MSRAERAAEESKEIARLRYSFDSRASFFWGGAGDEVPTATPTLAPVFGTFAPSGYSDRRAPNIHLTSLRRLRKGVELLENAPPLDTMQA